jgi:hypothetical protein
MHRNSGDDRGEKHMIDSLTLSVVIIGNILKLIIVSLSIY